jgi:4-hydroxybenzoyl-CoA reductase subunit beta
LLRLPQYRYHRPRAVAEALELLSRHAGDVLPIAGGTDLVPNMKHRLFEPGHLVALKGVGEMRGFRELDCYLEIGAAETLTAVASHPMVRHQFPSLAEAAAHVAGPQLRNAGTIGGNVCLDTRCTYYNQTEFWRNALGY